MEDFLTNAAILVQGLLTVAGAAAWFAALTPTPKDDAFFAKARKILDFIGGNILNAKNANPNA